MKKTKMPLFAAAIAMILSVCLFAGCTANNAASGAQSELSKPLISLGSDSEGGNTDEISGGETASGGNNSQIGTGGNSAIISGSESASLPSDMPGEFTFSSGAGGWATTMTLNADGSFEGSFHDSEMGIVGEDYPNGTIYASDFTGLFGDIVKADSYSYALTLKSLQTDGVLDTEKIEDGVKYITAMPSGLSNGGKYILYTPDTPVSELSEELISWIPTEHKPTDTLGIYALYSVEDGDTFVAIA